MRCDFSSKIRLSPSVLPLLVYLCGCLPTVYGLGFIGLTAGVVLFCVFASVVSWRWRLVLFCLFLASVYRSQWAIEGMQNTYKRHLLREECHGSVRGIVVGDPICTGRRVRFRLSVDSVFLDADWIPCDGEVMASMGGDGVSSSGVLPELGDQVNLDGCFMRIDGSSGYGRHLRSMGLEHIFHAVGLAIESKARGWWVFAQRFHSLRHTLGGYLSSGMPSETGNLYQSMMLGMKELFPLETRQEFLRAALLHVFAISGLHIVTIFKSILSVVPHLGLGYVLSMSCCCVFSMLYVFLTGVTPSSLRALTMILLYGLSKMLYRGRNIGHTLCLAALLELVLNPLSLFGTGFLFSYVVVFALVYGESLVEGAKDIVFEARKWRPEPYHPSRFERNTARFADNVGGMALAWLGSAPLSVYTNGILPLGVLVFGLLVQIVSEWLVKGALPKICLSAALPSLSWLWGMVMDTCMRLLLLLAEFGGGEGMYLLRALDSGVCTAAVLGSVLLLIVGWRVVWLRRGCVGVFLLWLVSCVLGRGVSHSRLFISSGDDGGVPAVCIVHGDRQAEVLCSGSKASAQELRRAFMRYGIEDVRYLPVVPQADVLAGACSLARVRPPRCAGLPSTGHGGREVRHIARLCEAAGTLMVRVRQVGNGIWQCGHGGASLEHRIGNGGYSMRFRRREEEVRMDSLPSGHRIVSLRYSGGASSRYLPPSSRCRTAVIPLRSEGWLAGLTDWLWEEES